MMSTPLLRRRRGICVGCWLALMVLAPGRPAAGQQPATYTYHGTVQAVRSRTGEIDLLTGVGHALRVVRLRVVSATVITSGDRKVALAEVLPGDIVRAACHRSGESLIADQIEKLGRLGPAGGSAARHP